MSGDQPNPPPRGRSSCDVLRRAGIDLADREDVAGLAEDLRWARRERLEHAQREIDRRADRRDRRARLYSVAWGLVATVVGGVITLALTHSTMLASLSR